MIYYKILSVGHKACHGGTYTYRPNRWTRRITDTKACKRGWHIATLEQVCAWLFAGSDEFLPLEVWECEAEGVTDAGDKCVAERIRLTKRLISLDEYDLRWLGTLFAESVLHNTGDPRVGECINAVRAYSLGFLDDAAWSAAESAAKDAAWSAAWSAARSAARSANGRILLGYIEDVTR